MGAVIGSKPQKPRTCELANWRPNLILDLRIPPTILLLEKCTSVLEYAWKEDTWLQHVVFASEIREVTSESLQPTMAVHDDEIWHPDGNGHNGGPTGMIEERYEAEDVALWKPVEGLPFNNTTYFAAESPRQLQRCADIILGSLYEADGISTGKVVLECTGVESDFPKRPKGAGKIRYVDLKHHSAWAVLGAVGNKALAGGLCGARPL